MTHQGEQHDTLLGRYEKALLGVFGLPSLVIERGEGAYVWDTDGKRYLDLVAGIAVNVLGHNHPEHLQLLYLPAADRAGRAAPEHCRSAGRLARLLCQFRDRSH